MNPVKNEQSCWTCNYQEMAGNTFLGKCTWFSKHKKEKDKDIPPEKVDIGCKYYIPHGRLKKEMVGPKEDQ